MRYFGIFEPSNRKVIAMADQIALGRVLADQLRQYAIGKASFLVIEVSRKEFDAYKRSIGSTAI